ncbi:MAG: iron-sulfur cluster assembly accessory protein [archaeon]
MKVEKDMTIAEVIELCPQSIEIMAKHGLHCVGCSVATYETLEEGMKAHGLSDKDVESMVKEIDNLVNEIKGVKLTDKAAKKIKEILKEKKLDGFSLRVKVFEGCCDSLYEFIFENVAEKDDTVVEVKGVTLFIDSESLALLEGKTIDYLPIEKGFKIR